MSWDVFTLASSLGYTSGTFNVRRSTRDCTVNDLAQNLALLCLGIGEADWAFKTSFEVIGRELSLPNIDLVFDGLDTFSIVSLVSKGSSQLMVMSTRAHSRMARRFSGECLSLHVSRNWPTRHQN
jgi:hypothetical protein